MRFRSSRFLGLVVVALSTLFFTVAPSYGDAFVYSQPADSPVSSTRASQQQESVLAFQTFDNFTLSSAASLTDVHWQGSYFNLQNNVPPGPAANSTGFVAQFYDDNSGSVGSLLASYSFNLAAVNETFVGQEVFSTLNLSVYNYSAVLDTAFNVDANTPYWFSVYALSPNPSETEAQWGWNGGSGGDGTAVQTIEGIRTVVNRDRAFGLTVPGENVPVPEPTSVSLLAAGLAGIFAARKKLVRG